MTTALAGVLGAMGGAVVGLFAGALVAAAASADAEMERCASVPRVVDPEGDELAGWAEAGAHPQEPAA